MDDKLGELLQGIEDKLITTDSWGHYNCSYCEEQDYPIDATGRDVSYVNTQVVDWVLDHQEDCIVSDIIRFKKLEDHK